MRQGALSPTGELSSYLGLGWVPSTAEKSLPRDEAELCAMLREGSENRVLQSHWASGSPAA